MRGYLDRGYNVVKMKIGGAPIAEDRARIEAVLQEIGSEAQLAVDANGRFDLETAIAYAKMLRDYPLFWYEEAGDPLDYPAAGGAGGILSGADGDRRKPVQPSGRAQSAFATAACGPTATGCNSIARCPTGCANISARWRCCKTHGWSPSRCIPHGGHQMSLNIAAGLGLGGNESYPDLFQPYGGFPDGVRVENGHITMPDLPGIGFEGKSDLYAEMKALAALDSISSSLPGAKRRSNPDFLQCCRDAGLLRGQARAMTAKSCAVSGPTTAAYPAAAGLRPSAVSSPRWKRRPRRHWRRPRGSSRCRRDGRDS